MIKTVVLGPRQTDPGGIGSVINEYAQMDWPDIDSLVIPTWGSGEPMWSMGTAFKALMQLVSTRRDWDLAHVHLSEFGSFAREGALAIACRALGKKVVLTLHGAEFEEHVDKYPRLSRLVLGVADVICCLGPYQASLVRQLLPDADIRLISNPVGPGHEPAAEGSPLHPRSPDVLFAGEIGARKGFDLLRSAWPIVLAEVPDARLTIVGPIAPGYEPAWGFGETYLGLVERARVRTLLAASSLSVLPSRAEVLPMFLLESLASGTPAIATKVGEWTNFSDCQAMTLIDIVGQPTERVAESLASAIVVGLRNPDLPELRIAAVEWVDSHASRQAVATRTASIYRELVNVGEFRAC